MDRNPLGDQPLGSTTKGQSAEAAVIHLGHEWQSTRMYLKQWYCGPCVHIFTS